MRIIEDYNEVRTDLIEVKSALFVGDYAIRIIFNDEINKLVDFKGFLQSSSHPSIRKYLDETKFKEFNVIDGNLNWNDYDMIFPVFDLYQGKI